MIPCKHCGALQDLRFSGQAEDGTHYGLEWETDAAGHLVTGSVRYICKACFEAWTNDDKIFFLPLGKWVPTAAPDYPGRRSYHLSALYSPAGMQTWDELVRKWLDAWDIENHRPRDLALLQQFYNNVLGEPFEVRGDSVKTEQAQAHRRAGYKSGSVPNRLAAAECGGVVELVTAAADVHRDRVDVQVVGWVRGQRMWSLDWKRLAGKDTGDLTDPSWAALRDIIERRVYVGDDGIQYRVAMTLIDAGFNTDAVYGFCNEYSTGVFPIMGRETGIKSASVKEFAQYTSKLGTIAFNNTTPIYKDRLNGMLKREWVGVGFQPDWFPNFPADYSDEFFKELTAEKKRERLEARTGRSLGFEWHRTPGVANHAWDLTVYNMAALEIIASDLCAIEMGDEILDWSKFWDWVELHKIYRAT